MQRNNKAKKVCVWIYHDMDGCWAMCGGLYWTITNDEGLKENNIFYCPRCGKEIKEKRP